jgi:hypothetical protein
MTTQNIFAFTDVRQISFPGYVSLNECYDKIVRITVRTGGHNGALVGTCAMSDSELEDFAEKISKYLAAKRAVVL